MILCGKTSRSVLPPRQVSFATGESVKIVAVPILDDNLNEGHETVRLTLKSPKGGARLGNQPTSVLTILDSDLN